MANKVPLIVYPAKDLEKAKTFFNAFLGAEPYADGAYYVGYKADGIEVGLDPNGTAVISYIEVEDIAASLDSLEGAGAEVVTEPKDVGGGLKIAQVKDANGNILGLRQQPK